jgi:hypothetical protein
VKPTPATVIEDEKNLSTHSHPHSHSDSYSEVHSHHQPTEPAAKNYESHPAAPTASTASTESTTANTDVPKIATVIGVVDSKMTDGMIHADVKQVVVANNTTLNPKVQTQSISPKQEGSDSQQHSSGILGTGENITESNITTGNDQPEHIPEAIVLGKSSKDISEHGPVPIQPSPQSSKELETSDADDSMLIHKDSEEEEEEGGEDEAEAMILRHVDSFGNLINADGSIIEAEKHSEQDDTTSIFSMSPSMALPNQPSTAVAMVIGGTDPRSLSVPPQYELKIHIIRGNISGGGLKNVSHVEVRVNDQLIHTTENVAAPPIWNETVHYYLHQLEFPNHPIILSLSLLKKRWTSTGFKLVGTMQLPLSEISESILDKYGIIEKEYNLNINRWNLTLTGNLYLGFQLRSIYSSGGSSEGGVGRNSSVTVNGSMGSGSIGSRVSMDNGMSITSKVSDDGHVEVPMMISPVKQSNALAVNNTVGSSSKPSTPVRSGTKLTRRASFRKMDTTYTFKTPVIGDTTEESDNNNEKDKEQSAAHGNQKKEELSEESSVILKIVERMGQWMQIDVIFRIWDISMDVLGIIFSVLRSIDQRIYVILFVILIFYFSYTEQQLYKEITQSISAMETIVKRLDR